MRIHYENRPIQIYWQETCLTALWTGLLNNEESESCLSCMRNTYWSSSSSLPNMKAIHWRINVTYNFEKRLTKRLTWDDTRSQTPAFPDIAILEDGFFEKPIQKFYNQKWKFSDKNSDIFHISVQNIDCGYLLEWPRQGGSKEYPQSMFFSKIRKIMYIPVNPVLLYKSGIKTI